MKLLYVYIGSFTIKMPTRAMVPCCREIQSPNLGTQPSRKDEILSVTMKTNLPYLDQQRLTIIFKHVYDVASKDKAENGFEEEKLSDLLKALQAMQLFNFHHRPDDTRQMYDLMNKVVYLDPNSEGTTYRIALILAIKELYGFSNDKLVSVMGQVQKDKL